MKKHVLSIIVLLSTLTACQKIVDSDKLIETDEEAFIQSYLSPKDTGLRVHVSLVFPSVGTSLSFNDFEENEDKFLIRNADVSLSDEFGNSTPLFYSEEERDYLADASTLEVVGNQSYFLNVAVDGQTYTATCRIPQGSVEINERITERETEFGERVADIDFTFVDIPGERNFYVIGGIATGIIQYEDEEPQPFEFSLFFDSDEFLTDALEDGGILSGRAVTSIGYAVDVLEARVRIQVANVEESLFQNLRSSFINSDAEGNPFVEYAIAPNTILDKGAVGVFAGYNFTEKEINIEIE